VFLESWIAKAQFLAPRIKTCVYVTLNVHKGSKMPTTSQHAATIALHAGYRSDPTTTAVAVPIYQTTSYQFNSSEHAANLFALKELGNIYSRIMNPTQAVLEERLAALEGGVAGLALASGQAASLFAVQNICHAGDNFVCSTDIYGGTWNLFQNTMSTMGIMCRFVDPADPENFRRATDERTRCYYGETLPKSSSAVETRSLDPSANATDSATWAELDPPWPQPPPVL
jgi:O-acetylhomoserine (thiol)-lyase